MVGSLSSTLGKDASMTFEERINRAREAQAASENRQSNEALERARRNEPHRAAAQPLLKEIHEAARLVAKTARKGKRQPHSAYFGNYWNVAWQAFPGFDPSFIRVDAKGRIIPHDLEWLERWLARGEYEQSVGDSDTYSMPVDQLFSCILDGFATWIARTDRS